jgi:hypothetical protein
MQGLLLLCGSCELLQQPLLQGLPMRSTNLNLLLQQAKLHYLGS